MLPSAEEAIVLQDPGLPGLRLLLDRERLSDWISDLLGEDVAAERRHLRYKPGTSCVVHVEAAGRALLVSALPPSDQVKHAKTHERAARAVLGAEPGIGVLVSTPAADRDLPGVAALLDPNRRPRLLERLFGGNLDRAAEPSLLRYKPHRRWVGLLPARHGRQVLLRAYRHHAVRPAAAALATLADGTPRTPRLLGWDRRRAVLAAEFLPGDPVHDAHDGGGAVFERVGVAMAALHRRRDLRLPERSLGAEAEMVHGTARHLGVLLPELSGRAGELADRIALRLDSLPELRLPVHGDFSADQAVLMPDGQVGLIDLDAAGLGDPAADLGCAAAALARDVALGELTEAGRAIRLVALHDGYRSAGGPADPGRVSVHAAAHLLRRTVEPFRLGLTEDWPRAAEDLLTRAEATLSEPARRGA